jgi:hypothetical protein
VALAACTAPESSPTGLAPGEEPLAARSVASPYTVQELGTVGGLPNSFGVDVNDQGVVAGYAIGDAGRRGFLLLGSQLVPLAASDESMAAGVSNGDPMYVVGWLRASGGDRSARWTVTGGTIGTPTLAPVTGGNWKVNDLGDGVGIDYIWRFDNSVVHVAAPGDFQYLDGRDIDDAGLALFNASGSPTSPDRAFLRLTDGTMLRLDPPPGRESYATSTGGLTEPSGSGVVYVAGTITLSSVTRYPARWTVNVATQQATVVVDDALTGGASDVSSGGTRVGAAGRRADSDAYAWLLDGTRFKLPAPRGSQDVVASAISDNGRYATGHYLGREGQRALVWSGNGP